VPGNRWIEWDCLTGGCLFEPAESGRCADPPGRALKTVQSCGAATGMAVEPTRRAEFGQADWLLPIRSLLQLRCRRWIVWRRIRFCAAGTAVWLVAALTRMLLISRNFVLLLWDHRLSRANAVSASMP
jgi:hypothetical protein